MITRGARLLVKAKNLAPGSPFALGKKPVAIKPLFPQESPAATFGLAAGARWHIAELDSDLEDSELWEMAYRLTRPGMGFAASAGVEFAEPDLVQTWTFDSQSQRVQQAFAAHSTAPCTGPTPNMSNYPSPTPADWRWFQNAQHSGLDAARARLDLSGVKSASDRVTIAHLDTGYREGHSVLPQFLDLARQHSFVSGDANAALAVDPGLGGFGKNPGHGTGTLSLLAGAMFKGAAYGYPDGQVGGAPFANVIPVRVASGVVEFANSSIAQGFQYAIDCGVDVLSMSMGGVPSQVWVDVVNQAYEAGIVLVTAAGNNLGPGKLRVPRFIVYPARFKRVLAACGAMSDGKPYADFGPPGMMGGSHGPNSKMDTALAGYTPNTPWASYDCTSLVDFDGQGTSAATPQVAASAACWIQKNLAQVRAYPEKWMRVEAVRKALFAAARNTNHAYFGKGMVNADAALDQAPSAAASLTKQPQDSLFLPILGGIFHDLFGIKATAPPAMLNLEAAQIVARNAGIQQMLSDAGVDPDIDDPAMTPALRQKVVQAMLDSSTISPTLKAALGGSTGTSVVVPQLPPIAVTPPPPIPHTALNPPVPRPLFRRLRVFAFDPALGFDPDTDSLKVTTLALPWEMPWEDALQPGPVGEYVEVVDVDPASGACYAPVDLNNPLLLATDGLSPTESSPQFHQQMVYAVSMTTIHRFERALGRSALWAAHAPPQPDGAPFVSVYVQRLRLYPHALREANAYYSPDKKALLFGYFQANMAFAGTNLPGGLVFNCLSHDIVAHETTHALLDGLHPYFRYPTNADSAAFHEAFADLVALFQHFSLTDALRHTIAKTRGDLGTQDNLLAALAQQFGMASDGSRSLRSAIGSAPSQADYAATSEAHDRGAILLAAVFDAFLTLYRARTADLVRLATGGTGVLPAGELPIDLISRLTDEAARSADRILDVCIRALDYCPPVDLTFGEYLRALITADLDLEPEAGLNVRVALISAFRSRGIYPPDVHTLSEDSLRWQPPSVQLEPGILHDLLTSLDLRWNLSTDRHEAFKASNKNSYVFWQWLKHKIPAGIKTALVAELGVFIFPSPDVPAGITIGKDGMPALQVHSVRPARRIGSNGQQSTDLVVELVQQIIQLDEAGNKTHYRGGCTLLIDLEREVVRYIIRKRVGSLSRMAGQQNFQAAAAAASPSYFDADDYSEPFAMLHRGF